MIMYAITSLVNSLAEVIGCEEMALNGKGISSGWADGVDEETLEEWGRVGADFGKEVERSVMETFKAEHKKLYLQVSGTDAHVSDSRLIAPSMSARSASVSGQRRMTTYRTSWTVS
jgi:hypothetical protein